MKKIKIAIIGAGIRGMYTYGRFIQEHNDICEVVAVVEGKKGRRDAFKKEFNLNDDMVFDNVESFMEGEKLADAVIICNYDNLHFKTASLALQKGYDCLLEGPVSNNLDQIISLDKICEDIKDKVFMAAFPYRHSSFFYKLKEIIDEKILGDLININYNSNIGYEKFAHNYVRGNWRIDSDSATVFLTNSCYDLDMLLYLTGSSCNKISSFGSLNHFKRGNFLESMSEECINCNKADDCPYCAQNIYLNEDKEINKAIHINPTKENLEYILKNGQYGKCVYSCDNDVHDNIVSILKFDNNVTATLNICAFTKEEDIEIRLLFTYGEIYASLKGKIIKIKKFMNKEEDIIKFEDEDMDDNLINNFIENIKNRNIKNINSSVKSSLQSHILAFAGEFANISDTVVNVSSFYQKSIDVSNIIEDIFL